MTPNVGLGFRQNKVLEGILNLEQSCPQAHARTHTHTQAVRISLKLHGSPRTSPVPKGHFRRDLMFSRR